MVRLEDILKDNVKSKNLKSKLQRAFNLYVNDIVRFPEGHIGQVASISISEKGNGKEVIASYYPLTENYDEKRIKQISPNYSLHGINFILASRMTPRPKIVQVDYSEYKGRSGTATKPKISS